MKRTTVATALLLALTASGAWAQSGKLAGTVVDTNGGTLPGVTLSVTSPSQIGGARVTTTGTDGQFVFPALAPGEYELTAELQGFASQRLPAVAVRLDRTTELRLELALGEVTESIVVTSEAPVIDPEQVGTSTTFTEEYLGNAVIGSANRSYQNVLLQAGGVTTQAGAGGNVSVYGSTLGENAFYIDGVDNTDPVTSTFGSNFNFDAIQEISFQTGGFEAEYGRATGGVVNVVTKSGGNQFAGTVDVRYSDNSFTESGDHFDPDDNENQSLIPGFTLGGPLQRDRVWFFLAEEYNAGDAKPAGVDATGKFRGNYALGKVTWQINPSWQGVAKYSQDPAEIDNSVGTAQTRAEAEVFQEQGGSVIQGEINGVLSSSLLWDLRGAYNRQELNSFPQSGDFTTPGHTDLGTGEVYTNAGNAQYSDRDRDELRTSLTYFLEGAGSHELKVGLEYGKLGFRSKNYTPAGFYFYDYAAAFVGPYFMAVSDPNPPFVESSGDMQTVYVQDGWQVLPNFTAKIGLRYDTVNFENDTGSEVADLSKLQPRLGLAWDLTRDGKTLARASWGRYMHPNATTLPNFARQTPSATDFYVACDAYAVILGFDPSECADVFGADQLIQDPVGYDPNGWVYNSTATAVPNLVDPNLNPTYAEELILSFERQVFDRSSVTLTYVDKDTKDIFEDTCLGNFPGPASPTADCSTYILANLGDDILRRDYSGAILTFESRATDWLHVLASYTWSKSRGSVEYTQNAGTDFDHAEHFPNTYGYLSDDRRHRVKLNGYALLPHDFTLGFQGFWGSGLAYDFRTGIARFGNGSTGYGTAFVEPRGNRRGDNAYNIDLELKKGFRLGTVRAQLIASIFNVLGDEQTNAFCERATCAGGAVLGDTTVYTVPRNYELGVRFEF